MITKDGKFKIRITSLILCCSILASLFFLFTTKPNQTVHAVMSGHSSNYCTVELNDYIKKNIPDGYEKVENVKDFYDTSGKLAEKWQLIRTKKKVSQQFILAEREITSSEINRLKKITFSLSAGEGSSTSSIKGSFLGGGGGAWVGFDICGWGAEVAITGTYEKETLTTKTTEQGKTVTFTVFDVTQPGKWQLVQVVEGYEYRLMRFTVQQVKATRPVKNKKGKVTGYESYVDHYAWLHYRTEAFQTNVSDYFTIQEVK